MSRGNIANQVLVYYKALGISTREYLALPCLRRRVELFYFRAVQYCLEGWFCSACILLVEIGLLSPTDGIDGHSKDFNSSSAHSVQRSN